MTGAGTGAPGVREVSVHRAAGGRISPETLDLVAVEEPLDIQVGFTNGSRHTRTVSITMRTPGQDRELAAGLLYSEGIVEYPSQVAAVLNGRNTVRVELAPGVKVDWTRLERLGVTNSSCGVCGKTSIDAVDGRTRAVLAPDGFSVAASVLASLPEKVRHMQSIFESTGGLHAAALFDAGGRLVEVQEDIGRHNALDKLLGSQFLREKLPLSGSILLLSGRTSFELVHKAIAAGVPVMAAVGAPSSLAIQLARDAGLTLAGFVRSGSFNIYCGAERIREDA